MPAQKNDVGPKGQENSLCRLLNEKSQSWGLENPEVLPASADRRSKHFCQFFILKYLRDVLVYRYAAGSEASLSR